MTQTQKATARPFQKGLYVLLDPETDKPAEYDGRYALQSDGNEVCDGLTLEQARTIEKAVNAHDDLVKALKDIQIGLLSDRMGEYHLSEATAKRLQDTISAALARVKD